MKKLERVTAAARGRVTDRRARRMDTAVLDDLVARVNHLERELEGLQDATYRQDVMHDEKIAQLRRDQGLGPS